MATANTTPGPGVYMCVKCKQIIKISSESDKLPICPKCRKATYMKIRD